MKPLERAEGGIAVRSILFSYAVFLRRQEPS